MSETPMAVPPQRQGQTSSAPPRRALIVKFGSIGDVIMAIPAAAALRQQGYEIDWVAGVPLAPLLRLYPWIRVLPVDEPGLLRGAYPVRIRTWLRLAQLLRARVRQHGSYHLIATLYYDPRYRWLTSFLKAERRIHLSRMDRRQELLAGRHHTDEYARILLGRKDQETAFQLAPVPPPTLPDAPSLPPVFGRARLVLVPAGARNVLRDDALRRWPVALYVALASALLARGYQVVLAGGPEDLWAEQAFTQLSESAQAGSFHNLIGSLSLVETLALLQSAAITVTHDTGPLHMAGLTSTAIVTLFGPTDPHGRLPRRANAVALWGGEGYACRPCYDGRDYAPCPENGCMTQITPEMVLEQVERLLRARSREQNLPPQVILPVPSPYLQITPLPTQGEPV